MYKTNLGENIPLFLSRHPGGLGLGRGLPKNFFGPLGLILVWK